MGVHHDARRVEGGAEHHIGGLAPDARQRDQFLQRPGHLSAVTFDESLTTGTDIPGLVPVKAGRPDEPLDFGDRRFHEILRRAHALEQPGCHAVDLVVRALGGENGRDQQFERVAVEQLRLDLRVERIENLENGRGAFGYFLGSHKSIAAGSRSHMN